MNDRIEKLEKHTHRLSDIAEYLVSLNNAKARDHRDKVEDFKEILDKCTEEVFVVLHERQVANPVAPAQAAAQAPRTSVKASASELKPEKLTHDSSASTFRSWKKCFKAYFDSAQMFSLPCTQQQAYLCNCIDIVLRARIDGGSNYNADSATWPTPSSASSSVSSVTRAGAFYTPTNLPTTEMPL